MRLTIVISIIIIVVTVLFVGWLMTERKAERQQAMVATKANDETVIPVMVSDVITGEIEQVLRYTGTVEPDEQVEVIPKITGRLVSMEVEEGNKVKEGQTIAIIDPEIVGQRFEPFAVTSPIQGRIARIYADRGSFVMQGQPIVQVINDNFVRVKIAILEKDYHLVKVGTQARLEFDALPGRKIEGRVTSLSPIVDQRTGTAVAEVRLDNGNGLLRPGMYARAYLVVDSRKGVVLLPAAATLTEVLPGRGTRVETTVFVVDGEMARERKVVLGLASGDWYEVLDGLKPGEKVVTTGQNLLRDGSQVRIENF
ncbi:MAG: efflux RND transporter periplasmic adaptor subunit [bacterium]